MSAFRPVRSTGGRSRVTRYRSRQICLACSPVAMFAAGRSSAAQRPSARVPWQLLWSISASLKLAENNVSGPPTPRASGELPLPAESSGKEAVAEFARLAPEHRIRAALEAFEQNGISTHFVDAEQQARDVVRSILPPGAEVYNNTSRTLEVIGVA